MKCNLVPASYRQDHRRWQRPACLALGLMLAVCAGAGLFFQYQIQREKAYYTDYLYPVQQQIQQRNDAIRRSQALADRAKKGPSDGPLLTPYLMVALASSKPDGLVVETVSSQAGRVVIQGRASAADRPQQWQRTLQQQGMGQAAVAKMQPDRGEGIPFSLEVRRPAGLAKKGGLAAGLSRPRRAGCHSRLLCHLIVSHLAGLAGRPPSAGPVCPSGPAPGEAGGSKA